MTAKTNQEELIDRLWAEGNTVNEISDIICVHTNDISSYLNRRDRDDRR